MMGGKIWLRSEVGEGSEFHFTVCLTRAADHETPGLNDARTALPPLRLLAIDDVKFNLMALRELLEERGHAVVTADSAEAALDTLRTQHFDAILLDVHMPEVDGYEAARRIRAREEAGERVPIVGLSASAAAEARAPCLAAGMDDYVSKPIQMTQLLAVLERLILRAGAEALVNDVEEDEGDSVFDVALALEYVEGDEGLLCG